MPAVIKFKAELNRSRSRTEAGHAAFYTLVLLPITLSLTAVAIDLSGWNTLREALQADADRIAFEAAQFLPDAATATAVARREIEHLNYAASTYDVGVPDTFGAITVRLSGRFHPLFSWFVPQADAYFSADREATAQLAPLDSVVIMPNGKTLRPGGELTNSGFTPAAPWGDELAWPPSNYFNCVSAPLLQDPALLINWSRHWRDRNYQRWATQSCFNPALTPFKAAVARLTLSLFSTSLNRVAVLLAPGSSDSPGYKVLRAIRSGGAAPGGFPPETAQTAQAQWNDYVERSTLLGSTTCIYFAQFAEQAETEELEQLRTPIDSPPNADCSPVEPIFCGDVHNPPPSLNECYKTSNLLLREAIIWQAAALPTDTFSAEMKIIPVLEESWAQLLAADESSIKIEQELRGNTAFSPQKRIFLFVDSIAEYDEQTLAQLFAAFDSAGVELSVIAFHHSGLSPEASDLLEASALKIQSIAERAIGPQRTSRVLHIFRAGDAKDLTEKIIPLLIAGTRRIILRR